MMSLAGALVLPVVVLAAIVLGPWDVSGYRLALDLIRPFFDHPFLSLVLLGSMSAVLVFQITAVVDAYRLAAQQSGSGRSWPHWVVIGAMLGALAVPHLWAADRALALYGLVTTDFQTDTARVAPAPPTAADPAGTVTSVGVTTVPPSSLPDVSTPAVVSTTSPPAIAEPDPFAGEDRITVALLGGDAGPGRSGIRTDTMIVASIDPHSGTTLMFSIPRNQTHWPIPADLPAAYAWECGCFPHAMNSLYAYALNRPELFGDGPNPGGTAVKAILGEGLGITIDYYAVVDMLGFVELVDVFGGIDINVTKPVYDPEHEHPDGTTTDVWVPVGEHHFDGKTALAYVRARRQDSDYHRMDRQRCVLEALLDEADPLSLLLRFAKFSDIIQENLRTDIPVDRFPDFVELLQSIDTDSIVSVRFVPGAPELAGTGLSYVDGVNGLGYWKPNLELIRATVRTALTMEPSDALTELNLDSLEDVCEVG